MVVRQGHGLTAEVFVFSFPFAAARKADGGALNHRTVVNNTWVHVHRVSVGMDAATVEKIRLEA